MMHPQRHFKVGGKLFNSYASAQLAPLSQSTYSSHTSVTNVHTIRHTCTQRKHMSHNHRVFLDD